MSQQNSYRNSRNDDHFDLDDYLDEKSNSSESNQPPQPEKEGYSWLKNTVVILGLAIITLFYFNDWSPQKVYGNIFGSEESQQGFIGGTNSSPDLVVIDNTGEDQTIVISGLADAEQSLQIVELEALTEEALANAFESLEGLEVIGELENLESLEGLEALESLEALEGLEGLEALQELGGLGAIIEFSLNEAFKEIAKIDNSTFENTNLTLSDYSGEINKEGMNDNFDTQSIEKLHEANIPISFLKKINELGLLESLTTESIINAYQEESN